MKCFATQHKILAAAASFSNLPPCDRHANNGSNTSWSTTVALFFLGFQLYLCFLQLSPWCFVMKSQVEIRPQLHSSFFPFKKCFFLGGKIEKKKRPQPRSSTFWQERSGSDRKRNFLSFPYLGLNKRQRPPTDFKAIPTLWTRINELFPHHHASRPSIS